MRIFWRTLLTGSIRKLKYISLADSRLLKDIVSAALSEYIAQWETANGVINLKSVEK